MKKCTQYIIVILSLVISSTTTFASLARLTALGGQDSSAQIIDNQTIFRNPADILFTPDFATYELGNNGPYIQSLGVGQYTNPHGEGGFVKTEDFGHYGVYLGHRNEVLTYLVNTINLFIASNPSQPYTQDALLTEQNPIDLFYADSTGENKWGYNIHYSNSKSVSGAAQVTQKQDSLGFSFGVRNPKWNAYADLIFGGKSTTDELGGQTVKGKGFFHFGGGYNLNNLYLFSDILYLKGIWTAGSTDQNLMRTQYRLGFVNSYKIQDRNFFVGASYFSINDKADLAQFGGQIVKSGLPVVVGLEVASAPWLVLRGSVTETVLIGENKVTAGPPAAQYKQNLNNDTTVAAGAGLKFNRVTLDGTLTGSTTGNISGNSLLSNASLTYNF